MNALRAILTSLVVALLYLSPSIQAANLYGKVVGISDGDTITILTKDKQCIKIRLVEIDVPEKDQPWGKKSKQALSDLVFYSTSPSIRQVMTDTEERLEQFF